MGRARRLAGSRRVRIALNAVFVTGALAAAALTVIHFMNVVANGMALGTSLGLKFEVEPFLKLVHTGIDPPSK